MTTPAHPSYSLEQSEDDLGDVRGQVAIMGEAHTKTDASDQPATPAAGLISYSSAGQEKYVSSDGNAYNTGRLTIPATGTLTLSAAYQTVNGLSAVLAVGNYRVRAQILLNPTVSGGTPSYQYAGSGGLALSHGRLAITELYVANQVGVADWVADGTLPGALTSAGSVGVGLADRIIIFDGYLVVSTGGTLSIQAKLSSGSGTIVQYGFYLEILPVS